MGSKTPGNENEQGHGSPPTPESSTTGGEPRGCHVSRDGDGCMGSEGATENGDGDGDNDDKDPGVVSTTIPMTGGATLDTGKKKKRKKSKKKSKTSSAKQSSPPRIPLHDLFPNSDYPSGELSNYDTTFRLATSEKSSARLHIAKTRLEDNTLLEDYRKAAEVHRQVRRWIQSSVKPGQTLSEIAVGIEDSVRALLDNPGLEPGQNLQAGIAFPTGISLNHCVAHYTPNPGQKDIVLQHEDVMKVDFGVHVNGWIVDSAFTMAFDPTYDDLLAAVRESTNAGIKTAGVDVRISDVSAAIQETMESHEVEIRGKVFPVKAVRNLCGHDIKRYRIHGEKQIPLTKNSDQTKMEQGEVFAIETFGTTGRGYIKTDHGIYGYGLAQDAPDHVALPLGSANRLYKTIQEHFGTLVFCRRYLDRLGQDRYLAGLNSLVSNGVLESHAPLTDIPGSYSAQFEHTILLRESQKEVISRGDDY